MAANPRMVTQDTDVTWAGVVKHIVRGTIVDIPPGSDLESAYGLDNLVALGDQDALSISNGTGGPAGGSAVGDGGT
jgi:hypothetical protein